MPVVKHLRKFILPDDGGPPVPVGMPPHAFDPVASSGRSGPPRSCRVFFWQKAEGEPILIGHGERADAKLLTYMWGSGPDRARRLAVISYCDEAREMEIHRRFADLLVDPDRGLYRPDARLLEYIEERAMEWEPRGSKLKERTCQECRETLRTKEADRFCPKCRNVVLSGLASTGYLQRIPRATTIKPENRGASRDGDPSPWGENAVKALEEG